MPIQNMGTNGRGKSFKNKIAEINYYPFTDTGHFGEMEHLLHRIPVLKQNVLEKKEESWRLENMGREKR